MAFHGQQNGFLQRLESVHLDDCGDVRAPFPAKLLRALKNLDSVKIEDCKSLEEVFELGEEKELPLLSSLTTLELSRLRELKCIWKGPTRNVSLENLVHLKVSYLNKLTFIFTPSLAQSLPKLERLEIRDCHELKHIIREEDGERKIIPESPRFPKLKKIFIQDCGKLEYVFPVSVSPSLPNLEEMRIDRADNLKQIFYSGEGDALPTDGIIKFPRLSKLSLSNCSFFGPNNFAAQLPSLEYLKIDGHKELENLSAQLQGLTNLETLSLKSLPDMRCIWKGLVLRKLTTLEMAAPGEQNGSLQRLECVQVNECGDVTAKFLQINLKTLKEVIVDSCESLEEIFELGEADEGSSEEKELPLLSSLTKLQLSKLPELKCIWKGPTVHVSLQNLARLYLWSLDKLTFIFTTSLARSLPKLERLDIRDCGELKHIIREEDGEREIIPESPCFQKLKKIFIQGCGKLEYVFIVSVSPSLPNLEKMTIDRADNLKQIFYSGEGDALPTDGIIKFPRLRELSLSNGSFFCPKNFAAQLPSLQILEINGHKELGNLFAQLQGLTNLKTLSLKSLPDMRCIWKGLVLSKLTTLEVVKCKRLTYVFTCSMIVSLVQLKVLKILSCEELEQIIARDNDDEKDQILPGDHLQSLCFPNLCEIEVRECNKLKSLFPVAMALGLPKLQTLEVSEASQLLGVFGQEDHASPVNIEKEMVLPNLKELSLEQLSSIVCLSFGSCDFLFPCLKKLRVYGCSKLTTKFATTPDGSMSAQSEVSEVAEDSSINREWTRNNGWKEVKEEEENDDC
ncbi:hypothetical protein NC652_004365 [Populus alba x Populus x berolinensis]|nr:hypothetical protein NC652_004365 [Populus alba x Populus x berolinensis]